MRFVVLAAGLAALCLSGCPLGPQLSPNVSMSTGLVYGQGYVADESAESGYVLEDLYFDFLEPTDTSSDMRPAVLLIHGGSFTGGTRTDEDLVSLADGIASQGYVAFLIDYRLAGDEPPAVDWDPDVEIFKALGLPPVEAVHAAFVDAKTAMRHIRANTARYGIDPDRIAALGESAGAFAALADGITAPEEFASDGPDFPVPAGNHPDTDPVPQAVVDLWGGAMYTPDAFDADDPPIMIAHGTFDTTVPVTLALNLQSACENQGIPFEAYLFWGEGHGCWDAEEDGKSILELTLDFLEEYLE